MFDSWNILLLGLLAGFGFGFLLQKGQVTKFSVIVNQFLFRDFTVLKIMFSAILVGGIGIFLLHAAGWTHFHIKPTILIANVLGGLIFGVGMVLLGFCPGTGLAAMAEKNHHAAVGVLGMLFGAVLLAEAYPFFADTVQAVNYQQMTLLSWTGWSATTWFVILGVVFIGIFIAIEVWEKWSTGPQKKTDSTEKATHHMAVSR